ncbi:MAG: class I SAM-dependent methyltransferase [Chloroflexota bacterium]
MRSTEEAVRTLRGDSAHASLIRDAYLDVDVQEAASRFSNSPEFAEVQGLLADHLLGARVLDLGAGSGIASYAFALHGASRVYALEPDPSHEIGRGAISAICAGLPVEVIEGVGERIPLEAGTVDIVYARQTLHHCDDLTCVLRECTRVLIPGGVVLACREHVVDNKEQLSAFLATHPVHRLAGGEKAFALATYTEAIEAAGCEIKTVLGPWDSVINAFPYVKSQYELRAYARIALKRRFRRVGELLSLIPGIESLVGWRLKRPRPGRMYTFLALKR